VLDKSKPELHYQAAPSPVTRGQFRLLLLLMLIQVVITAQATYAPGVVTWVKNAWAEHQQAVVHQAQVKKDLADQQLCLSYNQPADRVVWEEDPDRAAKLLAAGGYFPWMPRGQSANPFVYAARPGACANFPKAFPKDPGVYPNPSSGLNALVFMHSRKAAGQSERLVVVIGGGLLDAGQIRQQLFTETSDSELQKFQSFGAKSVAVGADGTWSDDVNSTTQLPLQPPNEPIELPAHWEVAAKPGNPGQLTVQYRNQLRVYAGQADPADASHFTIHYDLDGQSGTVDGWLKSDGSVVLKPQVGKVANSVWYPHAR
jgi:hypothetical protein